VRVLEREGFVFVRESGDHMVFTKPGIDRPAVVPRYNPLPVFIIKNALRTARISRERISNSWDKPESTKREKSFRI
jgi:predicted RNA binding protein YcfA (HicA-like mRNA interferase family)